MKKSILALAAVLLALSGLVGCNTGGSNYVVVYMLTQAERTYAPQYSYPKTTSVYTYRQIKGTPPDPNDPYRFSNYPELVRQDITGDTLTRIDYSYNLEKRTLTARRIGTTGKVWVDSLGLNDQGMAATVLFDNVPPLNYIVAYGQNSMRSTVDDLTLTTALDPYHYGGSVYRSATRNGSVVAEYYYKAYPNYIKLQQYTIPGVPYYWATDRFGAQSAYLLDYAEVWENGTKVRYEFQYLLNSAGFVAQEVITRDGSPYMTNTYQYAQGVVEW